MWLCDRVAARVYGVALRKMGSTYCRVRLRAFSSRALPPALRLSSLRPCASQSLLRLGTGPSPPGSGVRRGNSPPDCYLYPAHPAWLERPGQTFRGLPAQRDEGPPDLRLFPFRPAPLGGPGKSSLRFTFPLRLRGQGLPSLARPLSGRNVDWTFLSFRLAHGFPVRRAKDPPDLSQVSGSPTGIYAPSLRQPVRNAGFSFAHHDSIASRTSTGCSVKGQ